MKDCLEVLLPWAVMMWLYSSHLSRKLRREAAALTLRRREAHLLALVGEQESKRQRRVAQQRHLMYLRFQRLNWDLSRHKQQVST